MRDNCELCKAGTLHHHAGDIGGCIRAQAALLLGFAPAPYPDQVLEWFARGVEHEDICWDAMVQQGYAMIDAQKTVAKDGIVGHLDGIAMDRFVRPHVWEAKAPNAWHSFERALRTKDFSDPLMLRYAYQLSCYMHMTGFQALVCCVEDDGTLQVAGVELPIFTWDEIMARVKEIEDLMSQGEQAVRGALCSSDDWPCPVFYLHPPKPDDEVDTEIDALGWEMEVAREQKRDAEVRIGLIQEKIKATLGERTKVKTASYTVSRFTRTNTKLDERRMIEDGIDTSPYKVSSSSDIVSVTKRKGDESASETS